MNTLTVGEPISGPLQIFLGLSRKTKYTSSLGSELEKQSDRIQELSQLAEAELFEALKLTLDLKEEFLQKKIFSF